VDARIEDNRRFLSDLFAGPFRGHAILMDPEMPPQPGEGDFTCSDLPPEEWLAYHLRGYEAMVQRSEAIGDDSVPYAKIHTGTQVFAAAFGCDVHIHEGSPPSARPLVREPADADRLRQPALDAPVFRKVFALAERLRERLGPDVPISVPDIQSPFDIAALIWNKEDFFVALLERPEAVRRLVDKCRRLLTEFLVEFRRRLPNCNYCHCPCAWAPPELGCWLSEDEAGSLSVGMFEEFCLPVLVGMAERFGGMFVHCCATADHQYESFKKIPNLRGMNRVFQQPGPGPAIEAFTPGTVLMQAWCGEDFVHAMLDMARPKTRFLLNMPAQPIEDAKRTYERLRARCPRA